MRLRHFVADKKHPCERMIVPWLLQYGGRINVPADFQTPTNGVMIHGVSWWTSRGLQVHKESLSNVNQPRLKARRWLSQMSRLYSHQTVQWTWRQRYSLIVQMADDTFSPESGCCKKAHCSAALFVSFILVHFSVSNFSIWVSVDNVLPMRGSCRWCWQFLHTYPTSLSRDDQWCDGQVMLFGQSNG